MSCTDDSAPPQKRAPHSSYKNCAAESLPAALPFQTLPSSPQAFRRIQRPLHRQLSPPHRRSHSAKSSVHPSHSLLLLPPGAPVAPAHCAARLHFPPSRSAAAPRSHRQQRSFLPTHSGPPTAAKSAPPAPENPPGARAVTAELTGRHTRGETDLAETRFASPTLPDSGAWPPARAHSRESVCLLPLARPRLPPAHAATSPAWPPACRQSRPGTACRRPLARIFPHVSPPLR